MNRTKLLLSTICVTGLASLTPAMADAPAPFAGILDGSFGSLSTTGPSPSSYRVLGINGSGAFALGMPDVGGQVDLRFANASYNGSGNSQSTWGLGGSAFWAPMEDGRLGGTVTYSSTSQSGSSSNTTTYGAFGEWFADKTVTVAAKVGGVSFSCSSCKSGIYFGGDFTLYAVSDFSLWTTIDYASEGKYNSTSLAVGLEWLLNEDVVPVSVGGGYRYSEASGSQSYNEIFGTVKFYFNGDGMMSLRDRQRNGAIGWAVSPVRTY